MTPPLSIGPFALLAPVGRGATGQVWRGVHREQRVDVAIKLLPPARRDPLRLERVFYNEVRQAARLDHPGIVAVLDHGDVPDAVAAASEGAIAPGSRYLVMEYASGGSLDRRPPAGWPMARDQLLQLLDALAHAHARGVLHRDLKPANVLLAAPDDRGAGVRLTDLGIAHAWLDPGGNDGPIAAGTAAFMAPEQIRGDGRAQGPWTDLYALGCVGWWMACGRSPYGDRATEDMLRGHLLGDLPRFDPHMAVPSGFEAWLRALLRRRPGDRFRFAADAGVVLGMLGSESDRPTPQRRLPQGGRPRSTMRELDVNTLPMEYFDRIPDDLEPDTEEIEPVMLVPPPVLPPWRAAGAPRPPLHLKGAGLSLLGVRAVPMVGRDAELDHLWGALQEARSTDSGWAVLVEGAPGVGATALARAVLERAHELGVAWTLTATHGAIANPADGLARALARHLGCADLDRASLEGRLGTLERVHPGLLDAVGRDPLLALLEAGSGALERSGRARRSAAQERFRPLMEALVHLSQGRLLMLHLDDIHHSSETQAFVRALLDQGDDGPAALCLCTTRAGATLRPDLTTHARLDAISLPPLPPIDLEALVAALGRLAPGPTAAVIARSEGNPQLAIERVRAWAQQGALAFGPDGLELRPRDEESLPVDLDEAWRQRVAAAFDPRVPAHERAAAAQALALGAALGPVIDEGEWRAACDVVQVTFPDALPGALVAAGLAELAPGGLALRATHLRESILRRAASEGRLAPLHHACADMLAARPRPRRHDAARIARHRHAAGAPERALPPLDRAISEAFHRGELGDVADLLDLRARILDESDSADGPRLRASHDLAVLKLLLWRGRFDPARTRADGLVERARHHEWRDVEAKALRIGGMVAEKQGDLPRAATCFEAAEAAASAAGETEEYAASLEHRGTVARRQGDPERALGFLTAALAANREAGADERTADCLKEIGAALVVQGRLEEATRTLREACALYDRVGYPVGRMQSLNNLGDALRQQQRLDEAEAAYHEALSLAERVGTHFTLVLRANLGLVRLAAGRWASAREALSACLAQAQAAGRRGVAVYLHLALLSCAARDREWGAWDRHATDAASLLRRLQLSDPELDGLARRAADLAAEAGHLERAEAVRALAAGPA